MPQLPTFQFDGYTLRPAGEADLELARAWTEEDRHHAGRIAPGFWTEEGKGLECWLLEDYKGPVFFFRMEQTVRAYLQFAPTHGPAERVRTMTALIQGMSWISSLLGQIGKHEMVFDSQSPELMRFAENKLGFSRTPDMLAKRLPTRG